MSINTHIRDRDGRHTRFGGVDRLAQDVRWSIRAVRASRAAAAIVVVSLGLGIGANTATFTLMYGLLFRPLPVQDPESLYSVSLKNFCSCGVVERSEAMNYALWDELRREQKVFAGVFAYAPTQLDVSQGGEVRLVHGAYTSAAMWSVLGLRPLAGRALVPDDEKQGSASAVTVIGEAFWESEYARDPGTIGRIIVIGGREPDREPALVVADRDWAAQQGSYRASGSSAPGSALAPRHEAHDHS